MNRNCGRQEVIVIAALCVVGIGCAETPKDVSAPPIEEARAEVAVPAPQPARIPVVQVGEWRDYMGDFWDHNLRIVQEGNRYTMISRPTRGEPFERELTELPPADGRRWKVIDADEIYVIQPDGHLGLHDGDGLIRIAQKIE